MPRVTVVVLHVCLCIRFLYSAFSKKRKAHGTTGGKPDNTMRRRKALLSEEELLVTKEGDKVCKVSKRASETHEQALHRQEQNRTHLGCAKGSALQCCTFECALLSIVEKIDSDQWASFTLCKTIAQYSCKNINTVTIC